MKTILGILISILLIISTFSSVSAINIDIEKLSGNSIIGNTLYVGGSGPNNYTNIQNAIDNASDGDIVFVYSGSYYENVLINKSISLVGENKSSTIIDGRKKRDVIKIVSSNVLVQHFLINNSGQFLGNAGIQLYGEDGEINNIKIKNNIITNNIAGIGIGEEYFNDEISHVTIENNFIQNERYGIVLYIGYENTITNNTYIDNGIFIPDGHTSDNTVVNNTINGQPLVYCEKQSDKIIEPNVGQIILVNCDNITVTDQCLDRNCFIGIELIGCTNCYIFKNYISNKAWGIFSIYSENNNIQENTLDNNSLAIYLKRSDRNTVSLNTVNHSLNSINLYYSDHNTVLNNTLTNSRTGIDLSHSSDNSIFQNKIDYTFDHGIDLFFGCNRNKFLNNTIKNCLDAGIYILGASKIWWDLASIRNVISGNQLINNEWGVLLEEAALTTISYNNISQNYYGIEVISAKYNRIFNNNIFENKEEDAFFKNSFSSRFDRNFWNETKRVHIIKGGIYIYNYWGDSWELIFRLIRFDWHPAPEPYDIP